MVLVGAEGVVETGGVINKLGTYQAALAAHAHNTPFYVAAESYKVVLQLVPPPHQPPAPAPQHQPVHCPMSRHKQRLRLGLGMLEAGHEIVDHWPLSGVWGSQQGCEA